MQTETNSNKAKINLFLNSLGIKKPTDLQVQLSARVFAGLPLHKDFASEDLNGALDCNSIASRLVNYCRIQKNRL